MELQKKKSVEQIDGIQKNIPVQKFYYFDVNKIYILTVINPYPLDRPVSGSIISWILSILPKGSNIPLNISSVMLKCNDPTYNLMGPVIPFGMRFGIEFPILFFSAWVCWTIIGTPNSFCPDKPSAYGGKSFVTNTFTKHLTELFLLTKATLSGSLNSI